MRLILCHEIVHKKILHWKLKYSTWSSW